MLERGPERRGLRKARNETSFPRLHQKGPTKAEANSIG